MFGGIYSNQVCPICGNSFGDDGRKGLFCPNHPQCGATTFRVKFLSTFKRFNSYELAQRFLTGLRFQYDEGRYDPRDYQKNNPLGFRSLAEKYLEIRKNEVGSYRHLKNHLQKAIDYWQNKNIKEISYAELEDFLLAKTTLAKEIMQGLSAKTRANVKATLHAFWVWLRKRRVLRLDQMPEFPEIQFDLEWRKLIDKETQAQILEEVYRITEPINIKIWLGIKWLCTYISIRPNELRNIKEGDFNLNLGGVFIRKSKEKKPKFIPFLEEDLEIVKSFPHALPHLYFFRHNKQIGKTKPGEQFGPKLFYKYWKMACRNLGIEGVDLYGGTKHSSVTDLRKNWTPEQIKRATMHATNKAFERYFRIELDDLRKVYAGTRLALEKGGIKRGEIIDFKGKT